MNDVDFIAGLMRQGYDVEPNQIGFIPAPKIRDYYIPRGQYIIQRDLRGRDVGYLIHGNPAPGGVLTIAQAIIDIDKRNIGFGTDVVRQLIDRAKHGNCSTIKLRCAADLEANGFWQAHGFLLTKSEFPGNKRKRAINTYMLDLWQGLFDWSQFSAP